MKKLHQLIHTLSASEKRHFKLFADLYALGKPTNYTILFDLLNKQKIYNEQKLHSPFSHKSLKNTSTYLYKLILKSLRTFHADKSVESTIYAALLDIENLFNKGLYETAVLLIKKNIALAKEHEAFPELLRLLTWERKIWRRNTFSQLTRFTIETSFDLENATITTLQSNCDYEQLSCEIFYAVKQHGIGMRNVEQRKKVDALFEHPLLDNPTDFPTFSSRMNYLKARTSYGFACRDHRMIVQYASLQIELLEANSKHYKDNIALYTAAINNLSYGLLIEHRGVEFLQTINKSKSIKAANKGLEIHIMVSYYALKSRFYRDSGAREEIPAFLVEMKTWCDKENKHLGEEYFIVIYSNMAHLYFLMEDFDNALTILNQLIYDHTWSIREDIRRFLHLRLLITHFELQNFRLLESLVRSVYRFISQGNGLFKVEQQIVIFIKTEIQKLKTKTDFKLAFVQLKTKLVEITKDPKEKFALEYFDSIAWLESKIKAESYTTTLKRQWLSNSPKS